MACLDRDRRASASGSRSARTGSRTSLGSTPSGVLERSTTRGPRWWTFSSSSAPSNSQRCAYSGASSSPAPARGRGSWSAAGSACRCPGGPGRRARTRSLALGRRRAWLCGSSARRCCVRYEPSASVCSRGSPMSDLTRQQQLRPGVTGLLEALEAVEVAISQTQHPRAQRPPQLVRQRQLTARVRSQRHARDRVRAALGKPDQPQLREPAHSLPCAPTPACRTAPRSLASPPRQCTCHRCSQPSGRGTTRPPSPTLASGTATCSNNARNGSDPNRERACASRALRRHAPRRAPPRRPRQTIDQHPDHLLIRRGAVQRQPQHVVDNHPRRQQPLTLLATTRLRHHPIDQLRRKHPRQNADRDVIRQALIRLRLDPPSTRHGRDTIPPTGR